MDGARLLRLARRLAWTAGVALVVALPAFDSLGAALDAGLDLPLQLDRQLMGFFVMGLLCLGLHVQVGLAGIMQLGTAAFFGLGAYVAGIATVAKFPFQLGFVATLVLATVLVGALGNLLGAACGRLEGDALAMVTLGFAEIVRAILYNCEAITDGSRGLNPLPPPALSSWLADLLGGPADPRTALVPIYWTAFGLLLGASWLARRLPGWPLGRAWQAMRDDALALGTLGPSVAQLRGRAMGLGAALAGLAGALYATYLTTTAEPGNYDFNVSVMLLCAVVLGGSDSPRGALVGAAIVGGFDTLVAPMADTLLVRLSPNHAGSPWLTFANWRWLTFGAVLLLMLRLRPQGLCGAQGHDQAGARGAHA